MSMFFSRTAVIPVWFVVFALFALSAWPMPLAMGVLLLIVGIAVPVIILILRNDAPATVAAVLPHVGASAKSDAKFVRFTPARVSGKHSYD
jgi:hypothetical protein